MTALGKEAEMDRSEVWIAGSIAGRRDAKDGSLIHEIAPPADYTDAQRDDYVLGYLFGQRAQWSDDRTLSELERWPGSVICQDLLVLVERLDRTLGNAEAASYRNK